ncbi:hypothetical protein TWF281_004390 [Arthrobotrys megalospora]
MVNLVELPPEIQFNIYRELFHSQDFVNVCITCRTMNKIATPLLYEMVNISADNDYRWEDRQVRCLTEMDNRSMPLVKQLLNFCVRVENTKECMKFIDRLGEDQLHCIELFHKHETANPESLSEIDETCTEVVRAMFAKNKKLRALYVDMGEKNLYEIFFPLISASANWLTTLILVIEKADSFLYDVDTLISFLRSLKYLRSFELDMVEYFEDSPWQEDMGVQLMDAIFALPSIEQLVFGGSDFPYELYNEQHEGKRIGSNLTQFGFFSGVSCDGFLLNNFDPQRLKALRILWPVDTDFEVLANFLMSFKGLRSLHLTLRNPDRFDSLHCIAHHGGTLERLSLRVFTPDFKPFGRFAHTDEFEFLLKHCTALRELAVPVTYIHQHWYRGPRPLNFPDVLYEDLTWSFNWPNVVCPIESLHILNEPVPADKDLRQSYSKDRRMEVITRFAMDFHNQVNILGLSNQIDPYQLPILKSPLSDTEGDAEDKDIWTPPIIMPKARMTEGQGYHRRLKRMNTPLLPNLRSILFGDNTKCGRDSCLYLHDWEFEEMDLVPVVIDKVDFETGSPNQDVEMKDGSSSPEKNTEETKKPTEDATEQAKEGECPGGSTCSRREGREATTWEPAVNTKDKELEKAGGGTLWKFKEVDWAEFVGRFPWLHDFEIDARGWMDERTRIENKDKFRFWE